MASNSISIGDFTADNVHVCCSYLVDEIIKLKNSGITKGRWADPRAEEILPEFDYDNIEFSHEREVFEWYAISSWLACRLMDKNETIIEVGTMTIWGRTTTGQSIYMDAVIEDIYNEVHN
tara:strand:- start:56 stop:415 length:360 start_codon:yes stop_codon:yes gene_type:complete